MSEAKIKGYFYGYDSSLPLAGRRSALEKAIHVWGLEETYKRLYLINHYGFENPSIDDDLAYLKEQLSTKSYMNQSGGKKAKVPDTPQSKLADISDTKFHIINL